MASNSSSQLAELNDGLSRLLVSGHFSDLQVSCRDGTVYNVHKIILCAQSPFFMKALNPESNFKEAQTNKVPLEHDEPLAVKAMLEYFYRLEYTDVEAPTNELLLFHVHVYAIGETYGVQGLKKLACDRFQAVIEGKTFQELDLPTTIHAIYTTTVSTDSGLREKAIAITRADINVVTKLKGFGEMMEECAQFSKDLALSLVNDPFSASRYYCSSCDDVVSMELPDDAKSVHCPHCGNSHRTRLWEKLKAAPPGKFNCINPKCRRVVEMELHSLGRDKSSTWCPSCGERYSNSDWLKNEVLGEDEEY